MIPKITCSIPKKIGIEHVFAWSKFLNAINTYPQFINVIYYRIKENFNNFLTNFKNIFNVIDIETKHADYYNHLMIRFIITLM